MTIRVRYARTTMSVAPEARKRNSVAPEARKRNTAILALSCLAILGSAASASTASSSFFSDAMPIALGETLRGEGRAIGEPDCFRLETSAGLLMLDVAVSGRAEAEPRLALLGPACGTDAAGLAVIEQSATHLLVLSRSEQSFLVCVGAQDPRRRLGDFKLRTAFQGIESGCAYRDKSTDPEPIEVEPDGLRVCTVPDRSTDPEPIEVEPDGLRARLLQSKSTDPEPIEVEPDGLRACTLPDRSTDPEPIATFRLRASGATEPDGLRASLIPGKSTDPEPIEVEPDGLGARPFEALCHGGEIDDHGDAFLCATPLALGLSADGEIGNGWGDDHDLFSFELTGARTVRIETSGEVHTFGRLYDRRGQRLAAAENGGQGANFRLVKTLPAGLYFVRVEAEAWVEGAYGLVVDALQGSW